MKHIHNWDSKRNHRRSRMRGDVDKNGIPILDDRRSPTQNRLPRACHDKIYELLCHQDEDQ